MSSEYFITASIVLYKSDPVDIEKITKTLLLSDCLVYLVDNSPVDVLNYLGKIENVIYIHCPSNIGFGAAHNIALMRALHLGSSYHFIVNPDVLFDINVITRLVAEMQNDADIGMIMPKILNLDGSIQYLPKLLPSPFSLLFRKIGKRSFFYSHFIDNYELRRVPEDVVYNSPMLSGCFCLLSLKIIAEIGLFDENYFMYLEDWDLTRRVHKRYKTLYFPKVSIYHGYQSGANKSLKLFLIFFRSSFYYFQKWGWFLDKERIRINNVALRQFR